MGKPRDDEHPRHQATPFLGAAEDPKSERDYSVLLETEQSGPRLVAYGGPGKGLEVPVGKDEILIGRDPGADVTLDDPAVSRRHAVVVPRDGRLFLRDLGSSNGTWLDGVFHNTERRLRDGSRFRIGSTDLVVRDPEGTLE